MVAANLSEAVAASKLLQQSLEYLNDNSDVCYALSFNSVLQAWCVLKLIRREPRAANAARYGMHEVVPYTNNHIALTDALKDAIILKSAGK